jgi:outer membrane protein
MGNGKYKNWKALYKIFMNRWFVLLLLLSTTALHAQERLSLQDAIAKALEYNYDIRIAKVVAQQASTNNTAGNAGMLPNINATGGVTVGSTNTHTEFIDGRVQDVTNAGSTSYTGAVNLNWTLFNGGRMFLLKNQLNKLEDMGSVQLKAQIQSTISQVIQAYAQVVLQKQQGVAIDTGLSLAKVRMDISHLKYDNGSSAKVDYLQARVDYNSRRSDSLSQQSGVTAAFAMLNALMGVDAYTMYVIDDSLQTDISLQPTDKQQLENINLSLDLARRNAEVSKLNERIARSYYLPQLDLRGAYTYSYSKSEAGFSVFNRAYGPNGGLNLNIPIFQSGNIRREVKVASLQTMRDQLLYDKQNTELGRQYRTAWRNYEVAVAAYKLENENLGYAKENIDIQRALLRVGIANILQTREAESSYVEALIRLYQSVYNLKVSETQVLELENKLVQ